MSTPEVQRGAACADEVWDAQRHNLTLEFAAGFMAKFLMLLGAATDKDTAERVAHAALSGLQNATINKADDAKH